MEEATSRIKSTCAGKGVETVVSHPEADGATEATGGIGATWVGTETGAGAAGALIGHEWARLSRPKYRKRHAHRKRQAHWPAPMVWRTITSNSAQEAVREGVQQEPSIASGKKQLTGAEAEPRVRRLVHTSALKT
ncbi:hypothetical protein V6N12_016219 [Hibiscus sabdariffa]|uniref:Uncharacterized protein n=1 Tax=Hibiscus sabdariffa TaxID=183260 RepID=A0ABR2C916_9ROSI